MLESSQNLYMPIHAILISAKPPSDADVFFDHSNALQPSNSNTSLPLNLDNTQSLYSIPKTSQSNMSMTNHPQLSPSHHHPYSRPSKSAYSHHSMDHTSPSIFCLVVSTPLALPAPPPINPGGQNPSFPNSDWMPNFRKPNGSWIQNTDYCLDTNVRMTIPFNLDTNRDIEKQNQYSSQFEDFYAESFMYQKQVFGSLLRYWKSRIS